MASSAPNASGGFYRSDEDVVVVGVCGGIAERLRVHPAWVRLIFGVAALASIFGVLGYALLALMMPVRGEGDLPILARAQYRVIELWTRLVQQLATFPMLAQRWMQMRRSDDESERGRAIAGGVLFALGLYWLISSFGLLEWLTFGRFLAIAMCLVGLGLVYSAAKNADG